MRADHEAVRVEQGQGEQEVILGRPPPGCADGFGVAEQVAVQQHRALAPARRPRGVGDQGEVLAARHRGLAAPAFSQEGVEVLAALHHPLQGREVSPHPLELGPPLPSVTQSRTPASPKMWRSSARR